MAGAECCRARACGPPGFVAGAHVTADFVVGGSHGMRGVSWQGQGLSGFVAGERFGHEAVDFVAGAGSHGRGSM